jgi:hypothetical protein
MDWIVVGFGLLQTATDSGGAGGDQVGTFLVAGFVALIVMSTISGGDGDSEGEDDSGRQRRGLCENCGYEWKPRKAPSERSTDPQCPDCGSTRVAIHYN